MQKRHPEPVAPLPCPGRAAKKILAPGPLLPLLLGLDRPMASTHHHHHTD